MAPMVRLAVLPVCQREKYLSAQLVQDRNSVLGYKVMTWSGGLPDSAEYKSGKQPTVVPSTVLIGSQFFGLAAPEPSAEIHLGFPSARLRNNAHMSHIINSICFCFAILDSLSPTGSPSRKMNVLSSKKNMPPAQEMDSGISSSPMT